VQRRPDSLLAFQILAEASEKQNRPDTVAWRAQIARLQPRDLDSQLNLARLRFDLAKSTRLGRPWKMWPKVIAIELLITLFAGWLARAQGSEEEVEQHFAAAVEKNRATTSIDSILLPFEYVPTLRKNMRGLEKS
jgi:hypothetical protein